MGSASVVSGALDFADLIRRYDDRLRALAFRLLNDRDRMDDVLQDAYLKAFRSQPSFRGGSDVGTWLYRIVYNACLDDLRRRKRRPADPIGDRDLPSLEPDAEAQFTERSRLAQSFDRLTDDQKAVVWLIDVEGFDYADAAEVLAVAPGTVGSRLNRAHTALRALLGEDD